jgi:hypothetical protein
VPLSAHAQRMENSQDCAIVADMAVVAMALAVEGAPAGLAAKVMNQIYDFPDVERLEKVKRRILRTAYAMSATGTSP